MGGKFKYQVQDSDLEYLSWRFDKHITLSEKKLPLDTVHYFGDVTKLKTPSASDI